MGILDNLAGYLQTDPVRKAMELRARGQIGQAIEALKRYSAARPEHLPTTLHLAALQIEAGDEEPAVETIRRAFRQDREASQEIHILLDRLRIPRDQIWPVHLVEAETCVRRGDHSGALHHLERIPRETRGRLEEQYRSRFRQTASSDAARPLPPARIPGAYLAALLEETLGRVQEAREIYDVLIGRNPEEREVITRRFEALLATDYRNLGLRIHLGELHVDLGRMERAVQEFQLAREIDPASSARLAERLRALLDRGHDHHALRWAWIQAAAPGGLQPDILEGIRTVTREGHFLREAIELISTGLEGNFVPEGALLLAQLYLRFGRASDAMEWIEQAAAAEAGERIAAAYEEVIRERPDHARAYLKLGEIYLMRGDAERSMDLFRTLMEKEEGHDSVILGMLSGFVESNRGHGGAQRILGEILLRRGEIAKGIVVLRHAVRAGAPGPDFSRRFRQLLETHPDQPRLRLGLAEALAAEGLHAEALQEVARLATEAHGLAPEFLHLLSDLSLRSPVLATRALAVFEQLISAGILPEAAWFGKAQALGAAGRVREALDLFRRIAAKRPERHRLIEAAIQEIGEKHPASTELRYALVDMALRRGEEGRAAAILRSMDRHDPECLDRLLKTFRTALTRDPKNLHVRSGLSALYLGVRQFRRVLELGRETLSRASGPAAAPFCLDMAEASRQLGDLPEAARACLAAFQADPGGSTAVRDRLRDLVRIDPAVSEVHYVLGIVALHLGDLEEGTQALLEAWRRDSARGPQVLQHLERLCSLNPNVPTFPLAMVAVLSGAGQEEKAVTVLGDLLDCAPRAAEQVAGELEDLMRRKPALAAGWFHLGRTRQALGHIAGACTAYERAFRADPDLRPRILTLLRTLAREQANEPGVCRLLGILSAAAGRSLEGAQWIQRALGKAGPERERYLRDLEEVAQKDPENGQILLMLASEYGRAGAIDRALPCYETALASDESLHREIRICVSGFIESGVRSAAAYLVRFRAWLLAARPEEAVADLQEAARLGAPGKKIVAGAFELHRRHPDQCDALTFLADLLIGAGGTDRAGTILDRALQRDWRPAERIALLLRRWRVCQARGQSREAAECLREAEGITPDRNQLLGVVHRFVVHQLRLSARAQEEAARDGQAARILPALLRNLVDLGECERARELMAEFRDTLGETEYRRWLAATFLRQDLPARALGPLQGLPPGPELALAAEKCGDLPVAAAALEQVLEGRSDPHLARRVERYYRAMALGELRPGTETLVGETNLQYSA